MKAALLVLVSIPLAGQTPQGAFAFEVASVKPTASVRNGSGITTNRGGFITENTSLVDLIQFALAVQRYQISGGPGWVRDAGFDINARNDRADEAEIPETDRALQEAVNARIRARLRNLLAERFQLKLREDTKELPVYVLTVDKGGHKLAQAEGSGGQDGQHEEQSQQLSRNDNRPGRQGGSAGRGAG